MQWCQSIGESSKFKIRLILSVFIQVNRGKRHVSVEVYIFGCRVVICQFERHIKRTQANGKVHVFNVTFQLLHTVLTTYVRTRGADLTDREALFCYRLREAEETRATLSRCYLAEFRPVQ